MEIAFSFRINKVLPCLAIIIFLSINFSCTTPSSSVRANVADVKPVTGGVTNLSKYHEMIYATGPAQLQIAIDKEPHLVHIVILYPPFSNADMIVLKKFENMKSLEIRSEEVNDEGLSIIPEFKGLQRLDLSDLPITDQGIKNLIPSKSLRQLDLTHTKITNKVFKILRLMPELDYVNFGMIEDRDELSEKEIGKFLTLLQKRARKEEK